MKEAVLNFHQQFQFEPEIINPEKLPDILAKEKFILGGMGGSHLAGGIFQIINPEINLSVYRDYGAPFVAEDKAGKTLFIASSYSGNTEETLDFADEVYSRGFDLMIITGGGKLLEFANENNIPTVVLPDDNLQPRIATGYFLLALFKIILPNQIADLHKLTKALDVGEQADQAKILAETLQNKIPIIYSSGSNRPIAYNWKIKFNETAKVPAFYNSFPELNHNELQGYDYQKNNANLCQNLHFIFIHDTDDDQRVEKRMQITEQIYQEKGLPVTSLFLKGDSKLKKVLNSVLLADLISLELAQFYQTEPEAVPLIAEFKKRL